MARNRAWEDGWGVAVSELAGLAVWPSEQQVWCGCALRSNAICMAIEYEEE